MSLAEEIRACQVREGELALFWLGQAGFLLVDSLGQQLAIDPYLTNCGERIRGFKRISPMMLSPEAFHPDYYITTHTHFDHFDYDAIPVIARNGKTIFLGPESCQQEMDKLDIAHDHRRKLCVGDTVTFPGITITACQADHGTMAPDAIGLLVEMGGHRLYFSGDTAFHADLCKEVAAFGPEVAALSINGAFGNMTAWEGAEAANLVGASIAIPCHFWTFTEHGGAPWVLSEFLKKIGDCEPVCMRQGEMLLLAREA